ncbi:MAG: hypothetical protein P1P77_15990 [Spirochaetaceae bacterium]|nr:hypothetical protein [Spirochaetaceae bacterium]
MIPTVPLILNGSKPGQREVGQFIKAISSPGRLAAAGGYLFKSCISFRELHIGIVPAISEGERLHHYDITIPEEECLIGSISATGEFTLLFKADKENMQDVERERWRNQYILFAAALIQRDYRGRGLLDWITRQIIQEAQLFNPIPGTLMELAS